MQVNYRIPGKISRQNHITEMFRILNTVPEKQELPNTKKNLLHTVHCKNPALPL